MILKDKKQDFLSYETQFEDLVIKKYRSLLVGTRHDKDYRRELPFKMIYDRCKRNFEGRPGLIVMSQFVLSSENKRASITRKEWDDLHNKEKQQKKTKEGYKKITKGKDE